MHVTGLLEFGLQVPDLSQGQAFYSDFGLKVGERDSLLTVRCEGRNQDQTLLTEGPEKRLHHVAFAIPAGSLREMQAHLEDLGVRLEDAPAAAFGSGLWFRDPDGNRVNLREQEPAPPRAVEPLQLNVGGVYSRSDVARWRSAGGPTQPRRLGHMLIFVSDLTVAEEFYLKALGLRVTDRIIGAATFLNSGPGDHHVFGFIKSTHPGLHHSSWEVSGIDEMGVGAQTMSQRGWTEGWGLGRHTLGSNLFHYVRDPWGSWIEYFADVDQITDAWQPNDWDIPPAVWCPLMPEQFLVNLEARPA